MTDKLKLIVGCGYLGLRVARRWIAAGHAVAGLVRSSAAAEALAGEAVHPIVADVTQPSTLRELPAADTLLYAVGYDPAGGNSRSALYVDGLQAVLDAVSAEVRRVILISSTGVYAEHCGGWVDESSPCQPSRESGRALFAAEQALAAHRFGGLGIILRLAGIYGPGRLPRRAELATGEPLPIATGEHVNLIHVEDAAAAVLAAEAPRNRRECMSSPTATPSSVASILPSWPGSSACPRLRSAIPRPAKAVAAAAATSG